MAIEKLDIEDPLRTIFYCTYYHGQYENEWTDFFKRL